MAREKKPSEAKQAAEKSTKRGKGFLQGLKPVESTQLTSALKAPTS
jgi:hypothetical protein